MIDRVEVMRGGCSSLFGSSAVGGTINIITKDPISNSAQFSHTLTSVGMSRFLDNNTTMNASIVSDDNKIGIFIYGQIRNRDGYDDNGDGFAEAVHIKSQTLGARTFLRTTSGSKHLLYQPALSGKIVSLLISHHVDERTVVCTVYSNKRTYYEL